MMDLLTFGVVCPACKNQIVVNDETAICHSCHIQFPLIHDIVDLRYPQVDDDMATQAMAAQFNQSSFDELLATMLQEHLLSPQILEDTLVYYHDQMARTQRMLTMFDNHVAKFFDSPHPDLVLDLGCGSGAGVITLSEKFNKIIGLDSSLAQLLLAQKALETTTTKNYLLVCGFANHLPFKDQSIHSIRAINVLEHVMTIDPVIAEISRTLINKGTFIADSRNRFDVFFPEPHTGIRFLGYLPQKLIPKFVQLRKKTEYEQTRLLSYRDLNKAMRNFFNGEFFIAFPDVQAYQQKPWINRIIAIIEKIPLLSKLALWLSPTHIVVGKKN